MIDDETAALMDAYQALNRHRILPAPGLMKDQAPGFLKAVNLIDSERGRIERQRQKEIEARSKRGGKR